MKEISPIASTLIQIDNTFMKQIPIDEIYLFKCTCCGDCCTGNMDININVYDLYKIARFLKLKNSRELFDNGLIRLVQIQNRCWTPQIVFRTSPFKFCPWLINDLGDDDVLRGFCSLHPEHKPLICKMAPAGRVVDFDNNQISYMMTAPTENCPGMDSTFENRLSVLKTELKKELDFEYRFYQILDKLEDKDISQSLMQLEYYCFDVNLEFETILCSLEKKSEIL